MVFHPRKWNVIWLHMLVRISVECIGQQSIQDIPIQQYFVTERRLVIGILVDHPHGQLSAPQASVQFRVIGEKKRQNPNHFGNDQVHATFTVFRRRRRRVGNRGILWVNKKGDAIADDGAAARKGGSNRRRTKQTAQFRPPRLVIIVRCR